MIRRIFKKLVAIVIFTIIFSNSISITSLASTSVNFKNITIEDGLSQGTAETLLQDKDGYIWIGTNDGLNKYNGYDFTVFRNDKENPNSLSNNYIIDIKEDIDGSLWVGTLDGVSKTTDSGYTFKNYNTGEENGGLSHYNIGDILITSEGNVLIGTSDGLNLYNRVTDKFERILNNGELSSQLIYSLDEDSYGNLWIATDNGLNMYSKATREVTLYKSDGTSNTIAENKIYDVFCDKDDVVWLGTFTKGISKINTKTGEITNYLNKITPLSNTHGEHIRNFYRDSNDILWISTSSGLLKYTDDDFELYKHKSYDKKSLIDDTIFTVMEDKGGLL
ncbi:MAG: ligand-binding sensor domain-containing protein, partial [Clostridium sp.]